MTYTPPKLLTFEQFIAEYGDNPHYELIDGELRDIYKTLRERPSHFLLS